ncbi:ThiF family adenylyltransferase [Paraburkholderia strydomiana]
MSELVISLPALRALNELLAADVERGAVLFLRADSVGERYLVREVLPAKEGDYLNASSCEITFAPEFLTRVTRRAREMGFSLAMLHTHPAGFARFSTTDDETELGLADFMHERNPAGETFSVVLCDGHLIARKFGVRDRVSVRVVGEDVMLPLPALEAVADDRYDRQVRAFGEDGQSILSQLTVAIVGLGGTGSVAAQQLAHLGVGTFVLVDSDTVEDTNLNRVVGASEGAVGMSKVAVASNMIRGINPKAGIHSHTGSVISHAALGLLRSTDCVFICTDSHVSRAFLSEFAYQYLIPAFDVGVSITANNGLVEAMTGRTQMLAPGLPCLICSGALNSQRIREELMTDEQRAADPYFNHGGVKQPAVISLNSTMVSMAVTMFLGAFTKVPARGRWQSYDAIRGTVRLFSTKAQADCGVCGTEGISGEGEARELPFLSAEVQ